MSSRALRKLQREQEDLAKLQQLQQDDSESADDDDRQQAKPPSKSLNAFDMLTETHDDGEGNGDISILSSDSDAKGPTLRGNVAADASAATSSKPKSRKKKKNKQRKAEEAEESGLPSAKPKSRGKASNLDEIDLALRSLSTKSGAQKDLDTTPRVDERYQKMYQLLSIDSKHLNALNEMKRLFGNVVLEGDSTGAEVPAQGRRRGRGPQQIDLGEALAGRYSPVSNGQGLAGLALRRNVFMLGKEEWPKATSGGLGMEVVEKPFDGTTEYRFIHNSAYQDVQRQFELCVESLDPQRMIQLLQFNPYNISALLQVSEIAKQQGDHSVSGDLLERALFSFGRSVHSSFPTALAQGKARLDFRRPENREFWLAAWRYISNLGQRGTWRTTYEWAKLLLSLDPEGDPYCICLLLDQLALRGGQAEHFMSLQSCAMYQEMWKHQPNIKTSAALAELRLKHPQASRALLSDAMKSYPWLFARLFQELDIGHIPKAIWGQEPRTDREKFDSELYVARAKDLWNTPETASLLVEVAESVETSSPPKQDFDITLDEARHVLSDIPSLISLLPRSFTTMRTSSSDPLPPPDNLLSYTIATDEESYDITLDDSGPPEPGSHSPDLQTPNQELRSLQSYFSRIMPWLGIGGEQSPSNDASDQAEILANQAPYRAGLGAGVGADEIEASGARRLELEQQRLHQSEPTPFSAEQALRRDDPATDGIAPEDVPDPHLHPRVLLGEQLNLTADEMNTLVRRLEGSPSRLPVTLPSTQSNHSSDSETPEPAPYDDARNQRWLAGQGMLRLKDFVADHGADESVWLHDTSVDSSPVTEYVERVRQLETRATRNFILDYVLQQGTSSQVRDLVVRFTER